VRTFLATAALFSLIAVTGCSSSKTNSGIRMTSRTSGEVLGQSFRTGVADVRPSGETDIVMTTKNESHTAGVPSVTQVLHVRVLWQQGYVVKAADRESSQNATFHLYVYPTDQPTGVRQQIAEYSGTGMVELETSGDQVTAKIVSADLAPIAITNRMADPIGPCTLGGSLMAMRDAQSAQILVGDLAATSAAARTGPKRISEAQLPKE
jgi:hypothetical protein